MIGYCAEHENQHKNAFMSPIVTDCPYCRIAELEQQLARYQGAVEAEGVVVPYSDIVRWQGTIDLRLPEEMIGKQVRMLVKEVE